MVEKPEESFLARNFGTGVLYKPCTGDMQMTLEEAKYLKEHGIPDGYISDESRGGDFVYTNDDPASYPDIFENRKTDGGRKDDAAVIASIKTLSRGKKLKKGLDTHEIIRFFAAHNFLLNLDTYTGTELHNMIVCEKDGILSVMPWDYNLIAGNARAVFGKGPACFLFHGGIQKRLRDVSAVLFAPGTEHSQTAERKACDGQRKAERQRQGQCVRSAYHGYGRVCVSAGETENKTRREGPFSLIVPPDPICLQGKP